MRQGLLAVYKREIKSYLTGITGYVMMAVILAFVGFFVTFSNVYGGSPKFNYSLITSVSFFVFLIIIPFITMRSFAEERRSKTEQLLLSLPITTHRIVLAKYFAMLTLIAIPTLIIGLYPLILSLSSGAEGVINFAVSYNSLFMLFLLLAVMTAIGMFASSLVENQIVAALIAAGAFFLMFFMSMISSMFPSDPIVSLIALVVCAAALGAVVYGMTRSSTAACVVTGGLSLILFVMYFVDTAMFWGLFPSLLSSVALFDVYMNGASLLGVFDIGEIIYYLTFAAVFVFMTVESVERRRYN